MKRNRIIRLLFSILLIPSGAVLTMLELESIAGKLLSAIGLAIIVAGIVSTFHESVIRIFEGDELADSVAKKVYKMLEETPLSAIGIRLVTYVRKGYEGYYLWVVDNKPANMIFAGRSVLHRIETDLEEREMQHAETVIFRRLKEGSTFEIFMLDPRSNLIPRLAREERQKPKELYTDLATSIGICVKLYEKLKNFKLPSSASIEVHVFNEIPYFAYHKVGGSVIVGFYFSSAVGHSSAAYEVVDPKTKQFFGNHFESIRSGVNTNYIIKSNHLNGEAEMNGSLIDELTEVLIKKIGRKKTIELMGPNRE